MVLVALDRTRSHPLIPSFIMRRQVVVQFYRRWDRKSDLEEKATRNC